MSDEEQLVVAINISSIGDISLSSLNDNEVNCTIEDEDVEGDIILEFEGMAEVVQQASSQNEKRLDNTGDKALGNGLRRTGS